MNSYVVFLAVSALYIASPGPGVILTLSNALRFGFVAALPGIFGISLGMFCVGVLAATGISLILETSAFAFTVLKYLGTVYLVFLGIRHWRSASLDMTELSVKAGTGWQFGEGLGITLLNPKATVFHMALFPHFIDPASGYVSQFLVLATTFSLLLVVIHCGYSAAAGAASARVKALAGSRFLGRTSGAALVGVGVALAASDRTR